MMMPLSKDRGSEKHGSEDVYKDGPHLRCFVVLYFLEYNGPTNCGWN
jgi:hypothetical protein